MTSTSQLLPFKLAPPPGGRSCEEEMDRPYEVVPSVICSMCCLLGIIYCFFGYRCFKEVMFLTGLMFGSVVIFMLCYKEPYLDSQLSMEASAGIGLAIGALCGLVTALVRSVGLFMVGQLLGLLLGVASLVVMEEFYHPRTVWVPLGVLLGSGTLCAVLTLQWQRVFVTLSTAVSGAAAITLALDYFVELFALLRYVHERLKVAPPRPVCWLSWAVLGAWPALALLGVLVQWKVTSEGYSHTELVLSRQQRRMQIMRIHQKEGRRKKKKQTQKSHAHKPPQQQYHHPAPPRPRPQAPPHPSQPPKSAPAEPAGNKKANPVRRYDGDVLSPSYIRGFRERQVDRRAYPQGRLSRARMAQLDYDCGSQVPLTAPSGPAARL